KCQDKLIVTLAARHRLPAIYAYRSHVTSGGLISYASDQVDHFRRAAGYVDRQLVAGLGWLRRVYCIRFQALAQNASNPLGERVSSLRQAGAMGEGGEISCVRERDTEVFDQTGFPRFGPGKPWGRPRRVYSRWRGRLASFRPPLHSCPRTA